MATLFTLEALEAQYGDALLLHYGTTAAPRLIVIDGGPPGVYGKRMAPRLKELADTRSGGDKLPVQLVVVSHIDSDHVRGIVELTKAVIRAEEDGDPPLVAIKALWHNSFEDTVKPVHASLAALASAEGVQTAAIGAAIPPAIAKQTGHTTQLVLASVAEGRTLRANANLLHIPLNRGFTNNLLIAGETPIVKDLGDGLTLTVVNPRQAELDALEKEWAKQIKALKKKGKLKPAAVEAITADFVDKSVSNLSSIVLIAECGGKTMLLTGDVRGDYVIESLEAQGLKAKGKQMHFDIIKVPHHGSWRDLADEFFEELVADHYVFSANGKYDNPDKPTLESLLRVRKGKAFTVHMTNRTHYDTKKVLPAAAYVEKNKGTRVTIDYPDTAANVAAIKIDLAAAFTD
jgi:hypothetical protein